MPGTALVLLTLAALALLLFLILFCRLHAFLALLLTSMALGLAAGMGPAQVLRSIQTGFGEALGFIAVVLALGAMIGCFLEASGGGTSLAGALLSRFGRKHTEWAVLAAAFLVGLPIFFEVGFIMLAPLALSLAREARKSVLVYGLPMACALTVTHAMVPPHPAPSAAAQLLGADLGRVIVLGALLALPMAIAGGIVYAPLIARRLFIPAPERGALPEAGTVPPLAPEATEKTPSPGLVALLLVMPVLLIGAATVARMYALPGTAVLDFLGHPFTALALTTLAAMYFFGTRRGLDRRTMGNMATAALAPTGSLLAIMGGGGAFKQIIVDCGAGTYAGEALARAHVSPLVLAYVVAAGMRVAQGSATVAIITAAGIVAPMVRGVPGYTPEAIVLALCCGGTVLSHVNDAGFWLVKETFGMSVRQTLASWTVMKVITSVAGFALLLLAQALWG